jgi:predicted RNA-binding Zn ribbon-like protein
VQLGSYADAGITAAVELVNAAAIEHARGKPVPSQGIRPALADVLAIDPPSVAQLSDANAPGLVALAHQLREVFDDLRRSDIDAAASRLNDLLARHPTNPHLAKEDGRWRLHHHPADAALVPMWTAICAEGIARVIGAGMGDRLGTCEGTDCDRVFLDLSKNASRRFCSTACQNRIKAAAFRLRRVRSDHGSAG